MCEPRPPPSPRSHAIADLSTELAMIAYEEIEEVRHAAGFCMLPRS